MDPANGNALVTRIHLNWSQHQTVPKWDPQEIRGDFDPGKGIIEESKGVRSAVHDSTFGTSNFFHQAMVLSEGGETPSRRPHEGKGATAACHVWRREAIYRTSQFANCIQASVPDSIKRNGCETIISNAPNANARWSLWFFTVS